MNDANDYKCSKCGAILKLDKGIQTFKCEHCKTECNLDSLNSIENSSNGIGVYTCQKCGSEMLSNINNEITSCIYCNNDEILKNKLGKDFNPEYIIQFKTTKNDVIKEFKKLYKKNLLIPLTLANIKEIRGMYVPSYIYNFDSTGEVEFECEFSSTWVSSGYRYTKKDKYKIIRAGNMSFQNIPVIGSKKMENDIIKSIEPFDYKELKEFNSSYLLGFLSEKYNVSVEDSINLVTDKAKTYFIEEMKKNIKDFNKITETDSSINIYNYMSSKVLLPVWFLNVNYKGKIYKFAMNGQTGKMLGDIPKNIIKVIFMWLGLFIIISFLLLIFQVIV